MSSTKRGDVRLPTLAARIEACMSAIDAKSETEIATACSLQVKSVNTYLHTIARLYNAAEFVVVDGKRYWCLTPAEDKRTKRTAEAIPQGPGYRTGHGGRPTACRNAALAEANAIAERLRAARKETK